MKFQDFKESLFKIMGERNPLECLGCGGVCILSDDFDPDWYSDDKIERMVQKGISQLRKLFSEAGVDLRELTKEINSSLVPEHRGQISILEIDGSRGMRSGIRSHNCCITWEEFLAGIEGIMEKNSSPVNAS